MIAAVKNRLPKAKTAWKIRFSDRYPADSPAVKLSKVLICPSNLFLKINLLIIIVIRIVMANLVAIRQVYVPNTCSKNIV